MRAARKRVHDFATSSKSSRRSGCSPHGFGRVREDARSAVSQLTTRSEHGRPGVERASRQSLAANAHYARVPERSDVTTTNGSRRARNTADGVLPRRFVRSVRLIQCEVSQNPSSIDCMAQNHSCSSSEASYPTDCWAGTRNLPVFDYRRCLCRTSQRSQT